LAGAPIFFGIYAILKQKSKHNFSWELTEREGFLRNAGRERNIFGRKIGAEPL
jgi:hypothetical protein